MEKSFQTGNFTFDGFGLVMLEQFCNIGIYSLFGKRVRNILAEAVILI